MPSQRITVTLSEEQNAGIQALVRAGRARNTSEFVRHAVRIALSDATEWQQLMREALDRTGGPLTATERAWADAILTKCSSVTLPAKRPRKRTLKIKPWRMGLRPGLNLDCNEALIEYGEGPLHR